MQVGPPGLRHSPKQSHTFSKIGGTPKRAEDCCPFTKEEMSHFSFRESRLRDLDMDHAVIIQHTAINCLPKTQKCSPAALIPWPQNSAAHCPPQPGHRCSWPPTVPQQSPKPFQQSCEPEFQGLRDPCCRLCCPHGLSDVMASGVRLGPWGLSACIRRYMQVLDSKPPLPVPLVFNQGHSCPRLSALAEGRIAKVPSYNARSYDPNCAASKGNPNLDKGPYEGHTIIT